MTAPTCPQCGSVRQIAVPVVDGARLALWEQTKKGGLLAHYTCQGCGIYWTKVLG